MVCNNKKEIEEILNNISKIFNNMSLSLQNSDTCEKYIHNEALFLKELVNSHIEQQAISSIKLSKI